MPNYFIWLIAIVGLVVLEAMTLDLICIWFAVGAVASFFSVFFGATFTVQFCLFAVVSAVALVMVRPVVKKHFIKPPTATNADRVIGMTALVTEEINNELAHGQVSVKGQIWTARSADDEEVIPQGSRVIIKEISGVKLIVEKSKETKECKAV